MATERQFRYPGDPTTPVLLLTGAEFRERYPHRSICIYTGDDEQAVDTIPVEEILCDCCNAEIADDAPCAETPGRLYCVDCYDEWVRPYLLSEDI